MKRVRLTHRRRRIRGGGVTDEGDRNKAEKNWPVSASEKQRIAGKLLSLAEALITE